MLMGWLMHIFWDLHKGTTKDVSDLSKEVHKDFARHTDLHDLKSDMEKLGDRIFGKLDRIEEKIDHKADK